MFVVQPRVTGSRIRRRPSSPQVKQENQPYTLTITGNSHFSEKDLLKAAAAELQMFKQRGYRKADIDDAAFQMRLTYLQAGFPFAAVDYSYEQKDNVLRVVFTIEEGAQVFIQKVQFEGNLLVKTDTLLGFFPKLTNGKGIRQKMIFIESEVKDIVSKIREYYRGEGFVDVHCEKTGLCF